MRLLVLTILVITSMLLTGCQLAEVVWMETYRIKGGYYDRPPQTQKAKP